TDAVAALPTGAARGEQHFVLLLAPAALGVGVGTLGEDHRDAKILDRDLVGAQAGDRLQVQLAEVFEAPGQQERHGRAQELLAVALAAAGAERAADQPDFAVVRLEGVVLFGVAVHGGVAAVVLDADAVWQDGADLLDQRALVGLGPVGGHAEEDTVGVGLDQQHAAPLQLDEHLAEHFAATAGHFAGRVEVAEEGEAGAEAAVERVDELFHGAGGGFVSVGLMAAGRVAAGLGLVLEAQGGQLTQERQEHAGLIGARADLVGEHEARVERGDVGLDDVLDDAAGEQLGAGARIRAAAG